MTDQPLDPMTLKPNVRLSGTVNDAMLSTFTQSLDTVMGGSDPVVVELFTSGGDADVGRRIALELALCREKGRDVLFLGKTIVYSAGVSIMSGVPAGRRYLTRDCLLLIHERRLDMQVHFYGPLRATLQVAQEMVSQIEIGQTLERQGFEALIEGSTLSLDDLMRRAQTNWYVTAREALDLGLVAGVI